MAVSESYKEFVEDQLSELGEFQIKRMFGGVGYFINGEIFAAIMGDVFRMKVTEGNKEDFLVYGMEPWSPPGKKMTMPYYEVPQEVLNDKSLLRDWCLKAHKLAKK